MLKRISLQNFKSFGIRQDVPLAPLSVLVGANNTGKSCFLSLARFLHNALRGGALKREGGVEAVLHRPPHGNGELVVGWATEQGEYESRSSLEGDIRQLEERLVHHDLGPAWEEDGGFLRFRVKAVIQPPPSARKLFEGLRWARTLAEQGHEEMKPFEALWSPWVNSRLLRLDTAALGSDTNAIDDEWFPGPVLKDNGQGLAAVIARWDEEEREPTVDGRALRSADPRRAAEFRRFVMETIPEVRAVHARARPDGGWSLVVEQQNGQEFAGSQVSDGVLATMGFAAHVFAAPRGGVLFIEEPENHVHPLRLRALVDMFRRAVRERGCQVLLSTHSPVLLNEFRDEADCVLLFRRSAEGTRVAPLTEVPWVREELATALPGDLMQAGFFAEAP
ncbi:MAG: AAA family ATPase [Deltaproteobacteria bacterium]|nr:AAA family ATPase [Deltaproteobacteria bacterium]